MEGNTNTAIDRKELRRITCPYYFKESWRAVNFATMPHAGFFLIRSLDQVSFSHPYALGNRVLEARDEDRGRWVEIRETIETRRKLTDTERRLLEMKQAVVSVDELRAIVAFILQSVKDHVIGLDGGRRAVNGVAFDLNRLLMPGLSRRLASEWLRERDHREWAVRAGAAVGVAVGDLLAVC